MEKIDYETYAGALNSYRDIYDSKIIRLIKMYLEGTGKKKLEFFSPRDYHNSFIEAGKVFALRSIEDFQGCVHVVYDVTGELGEGEVERADYCLDTLSCGVLENTAHVIMTCMYYGFIK